MRHFLKSVGFDNTQLKWILRRMSKAANRSSYIIWNSRFDSTWSPPVIARPIVSDRFPAAQATVFGHRDEALAFLSNLSKPTPTLAPGNRLAKSIRRASI